MVCLSVSLVCLCVCGSVGQHKSICLSHLYVKDDVQIIIEEKLKGVNVALTTVHHLYVVIQAVILCSWMPQFTARAFQFQQKKF